jgi:Tol biopolymer transport system component
LSLTGTILPAFSPTGDQFVTNTRAGANNLGASLSVTNTATGSFKLIHEDKNRNVLAPQWSPSGDRIIFSSYSGTEVKLNDTELLIMSEDDILAVVD